MYKIFLTKCQKLRNFTNARNYKILRICITDFPNSLTFRANFRCQFENSKNECFSWWSAKYIIMCVGCVNSSLLTLLCIDPSTDGQHLNTCTLIAMLLILNFYSPRLSLPYLHLHSWSNVKKFPTHKHQIWQK